MDPLDYNDDEANSFAPCPCFSSDGLVAGARRRQTYLETPIENVKEEDNKKGDDAPRPGGKAGGTVVFLS
jgi:hypothetical protein